MYYLKYRPQELSALDNATRRETLIQLFSQKNIPHAFLLVGAKGTGKTSTARIIAKILNCTQRGSKPEPCNECDNCQAINKNRFFDVYELDAASNRGIDDVRALREQAGYAPAAGKYKVYIIDEVHMLTKEAFNALLKTLEEPPSFTVFILATTEAHKLPETVVSRCIVMQFQKATNEEIKHSLKRIVDGEKLKLDEKILDLVASLSGGSFRDAAKLLEMAVASTDHSYEKVLALLSQNSGANPQEFLELFLTKKTKESFAWLEEFEKKGGNFTSLLEDLLERLRQCLLVKRELEENQLYAQLIKSITLKELGHLLKLLMDAYQLGKFSPIDSLPLMIAVVENENAK